MSCQVIAIGDCELRSLLIIFTQKWMDLLCPQHQNEKQCKEAMKTHFFLKSGSLFMIVALSTPWANLR